MSLYNILHGINPATFFILPMLGEKHPDQYPRFRDCFVTSKNEIVIYTRVGGPNRGCGYGEEVLQQHENFLYYEEDENDNTYGIYVFSVPEQWKEDFEKVIAGKARDVSQAYRDRLYTVFPKLKDTFDKLFQTVTNENKE